MRGAVTVNTKVCAENNIQHWTIIQSHNVKQGTAARETYPQQQEATCMRFHTEHSDRRIEKAGNSSKE